MLSAVALVWAGFCAHYLLSSRMGSLEERMEQHLRDTQEALSMLRLRVDALGEPADTKQVSENLRAALDDLEARLEGRLGALEDEARKQ